MPHQSDPMPQALALAAGSPAMQAQLVAALARDWDPHGVVGAALAARPEAPDPTRPRSLADVARDVAGLLAAGGTESEVGGYLRREEVAVLPMPATAAEAELRRIRRDRVRVALWRLVRGLGDAAPEERPDA